jgi:predicted PurR-regulated permease PerM
MKFPRFWQDQHKEPLAPAPASESVPAGPAEVGVVRLDADQLRAMSAVFSAPRWLRDLGIASWFLVGVALLVVGLTWVLGMTSTIVEPVLVGGVVATVASPAVTRLKKHRVPRAAGALIVLILLLALGVVILLLVLGGIVAEGDKISAALRDAFDKIQEWIVGVGVDSSAASSANANVSSTVPEMVHTFVSGVANGIQGIASLAFGVSFTIFSLFFLLKDGPALRAWVNRHLGVPAAVANTITGGVVHAMRRYFLGVTIVAAFNAVVVGLGARILDVPLAGTIAVVTLVTAYIPFIGAVVSGAFAVLLALGSQGTTTALIMLVIVILANGMLQNIVSPIAMGATLRMNPLLILVVTISAGAFFGMAGMVLAAPLTSAAIHISADLRRVRAHRRVRRARWNPDLPRNRTDVISTDP